MKKHWTELSKSPHYVHEMRREFMLEHQRADEILISKEGIPLKAIYYSPELPGYGSLRTDEWRELVLPELKDIK